MKSLTGREIENICICSDECFNCYFIKFVGTFDPRNFILQMSVTFAGVTVGPLFGNLRDGLKLKVTLSLVEGQITFSFTEEKVVLAHVDLKFTSLDPNDRQHLERISSFFGCRGDVDQHIVILTKLKYLLLFILLLSKSSRCSDLLISNFKLPSILSLCPIVRKKIKAERNKAGEMAKKMTFWAQIDSHES